MLQPQALAELAPREQPLHDTEKHEGDPQAAFLKAEGKGQQISQWQAHDPLGDDRVVERRLVVPGAAQAAASLG